MSDEGECKECGATITRSTTFCRSCNTVLPEFVEISGDTSYSEKDKASEETKSPSDSGFSYTPLDTSKEEETKKPESPPSSGSEPESEPVQEPVGDPEPEPKSEPVQEPVGDPEPEPESEPVQESTDDPEPEPESEPVQEPVGDPEPELDLPEVQAQETETEPATPVEPEPEPEAEVEPEQQQYAPQQQQDAPPVQHLPPPLPQRSKAIAALFCFFLGWLGIHNFYLGRIGCGIAQLILTVTIVGIYITLIWCFVDFILILSSSFTDRHNRPLV